MASILVYLFLVAVTAIPLIISIRYDRRHPTPTYIHNEYPDWRPDYTNYDTEGEWK